MDRKTAQDLIDTYCDDVPLEDAVERLMRSTLNEADLDLLQDGTNDQVREIQDRLDEILYGPPGSQRELPGYSAWRNRFIHTRAGMNRASIWAA